MKSRGNQWAVVGLRGLGLALLLGFGSHGVAAAQSVQATVDRNQIALDEQLQLTVRVEGSQRVRPELPPMPDFEVIERGQSTSMQIINGRVSQALSFNYILVPRRTGTFTIGPATAELNGETFSSRAFTVTVLEASAEPSQSRDHFVVARVGNEAPFVGEQVLFTWRFYWRTRPADARLGTLAFGDLLVEDLGEVREYQTTVGGVQYAVSEIRKVLFAQRPGTFVIPSSDLNISVPVQRQRSRRSLLDDFFGSVQTRNQVLRTEPIELEVRPLPPAPQGFSGLVGTFEVRSAITKRELKVGESATLEVTVSGTGNAQLIAEPPLPDLSQFKLYDDSPVSSVDRSGTQMRGSKSFRKALVPLVSGSLTIDPVSLIYFDPGAEQYRTATTEPIELEVAPSEGTEELMLTESMAPTTGKVAVRILADDILPVHRGLEVLESERLHGWRAWLWGGLWLLPIAGFGTLLILQRRRASFDADRGLRRRRGALRRAMAEVDSIESGDVRERAARSSRILREYVGDKLGVEGSALTPIEVEGMLEERGVEEGLARRIREVLDRLEAAQYASGTMDRPGSGGPALGPLLRDLEKALESSSR